MSRRLVSVVTVGAAVLLAVAGSGASFHGAGHSSSDGNVARTVSFLPAIPANVVLDVPAAAKVRLVWSADGPASAEMVWQWGAGESWPVGVLTWLPDGEWAKLAGYPGDAAVFESSGHTLVFSQVQDFPYRSGTAEEAAFLDVVRQMADPDRYDDPALY